jgi:hypothetical protein
MALNGKALSAIMIGQMGSQGILGTAMPGFCEALSEGIVTGFLSQNQVTTVDTGVLPAGAPGVGIGKMAGIVGSAMFGVTMPLVASGGFLGTKSTGLIKAVTEALALHFTSTNIVNTQHPTVAIGAGVGKVLGLSGAGIASIAIGLMTSKGIAGPQMPGLVKAICEGFAINVMATGIVSVSIVGAPLVTPGGTVPSAGSGTGKIT